MGTSLIEISSEEGKYIKIELSVAEAGYEPDDAPLVILSSSLLEKVDTVSFNLGVPSEEELPEGLGLKGFAVELGIGGVMLEEGETVTVCLPAPSFEDGEELMPKLYRYEEEWNLLSGSRTETVNNIEFVCGNVSSLPSLFGVFVEIPEPPVMEKESDGGCSVASDGADRSGLRSAAFNFNLLLIVSGLLAVSLKRRRAYVRS